MSNLNTNKVVGLASVAPESEIDSEISQVLHQVAELDEKLMRLVDRLAPVRNQNYGAVGSVGDSKAEAERSLSPMGERVRSAKCSVHCLVVRVDYLLNELAV